MAEAAAAEASATAAEAPAGAVAAPEDDSLAEHSLPTLPPSPLVHVLSFLAPPDLARVARTCAALRFPPSHWQLWEAMTRRAFPAAPAPEDGHWKRTYHWQSVIKARAALYQRDMTLGLLGRRREPPPKLAEPRVDAYELDREGFSRPLAMMATRRMKARLRALKHAEDAPPKEREPEPEPLAAELSLDETRRGDGDDNESSDAAPRSRLMLRQGSAPWSALA